MLLSLLDGLCSLSSAAPVMLDQQDTIGEVTIPRSALRIGALSGVLELLDSLPHLAGMQLQEQVMIVLGSAWRTVVVSGAGIYVQRMMSLVEQQLCFGAWSCCTALPLECTQCVGTQSWQENV